MRKPLAALKVKVIFGLEMKAKGSCDYEGRSDIDFVFDYAKIK